MKKTTLKISGMHCASCATLLTKSLEKTPGVKSALVNYGSEKALIEHNKKISPPQLISVIKKKGYGAILETRNLNNIEEKKRKKEIERQKYLLFLGIALSVPALIFGMFLMSFPYREYILFALATPVQFVLGWQFYKGAWTALKNKTSNMDTLIALGTSAAYFFSVYAIFFTEGMEQYFETSTVLITLVVLGKFLEARAKGKTSSAIKKLMNLSPKKALVIRDGKEMLVSADLVVKGDIIRVKPGEKIPVDGIITEGYTSIDESMITGESIPVEKDIKSKVIGGTINKNGSILFRATGVGSDTVLSQIIKLVEDAQGQKAPIQRFADSVSSYFVPIVLVIAFFTFLGWYYVGSQSFSFSLIVAVAVLVIACPCSLGLATPTAIMVGTGKGAEQGILIKGGEALETTHKIKYLMFDKTGTITHGKPVVTDVISINNEKISKILSVSGSIEKSSEHPLAEAIVAYASKRKAKIEKISNFSAIPGKGVTAKIKSKTYFFGSPELCVSKKIRIRDYTQEIQNLQNEGKTVMILTDSRKALGIIAVADTIKPNTAKAVRKILKLGIIPVMITGDNERTANAIAKKAGIKHVFANVLPDKKAERVRILQKKGKVAMVGDGINDAPALAQSDVGIAMSSGTDIAMESGSIVLMKNDIMDVPRAIILSKQTMSKIRQNMFWALFYNVLGIPIAAGILYPFTGWLLNPMIAGAAMALSSVSVVSNSLLLKTKKLR